MVIDRYMIITEPYLMQRDYWPTRGRHILAQWDESSILVYQAYRHDIAEFAVKNQYFGGSFSLNRMSWIKPNFLWMMYRSGWGTKPGQEVVLAIRLKRAFFEHILAEAVFSTFQPELYDSREAWKRDVAVSDVRLQWDPDHAPSGAKEERRAIQLGLRGEVLRRYSREWLLEIIDLSDLVAAQRGNINELDALSTPRERVYPVDDNELTRRLGLTPSS